MKPPFFTVASSRHTLLAWLCLLGLAAVVLPPTTRAEIIGVEQFDYPDGAIATKSGGTFWDYKNFTPTGHTGTASTWDNFSGTPSVASGRLVTDNTSAIRQYNGTLESDGAVNDPASVPSSVAKSVYYRVTFTTGATLPSFIRISSSDFGTDIVSFGASLFTANSQILGLQVHPQSFTSNSATAVAPNTTYTLVTKVDYASDVVSLYLNPDLNAAEGSVTPLRTFTGFTATNWSTAIRLASGAGGAVAWDDVVVATTWDELGTVVTTTADEDNGSLVPTAGGGAGVSLREAVKYSPTGSLITFDPGLSGQTITLTGGYISTKTLTIDASALPEGLTVDGNNSSRLFVTDYGSSVSLRGLTLTRGFSLADGGAIVSGGALTLTQCTLTDNIAWALGGAITSVYGPLTLTQCTLTGNLALESGGAIYCANALTLKHCTLTGNTGYYGGAIRTEYGSLNLNNSIVAGNTAPSGPDINNNVGINATGVNLIGNLSSSGLTAGPSVLVGDPKLSPLGYFGGPTMTMHPLIGSPAIDAAGTSDPGGKDARGFPRFVDGDTASAGAQLDIGAVEAGPLLRVNTATDAGGATLRNLLDLLNANAVPGERLGFEPAVFPATITLNGTEVSIPATGRIFIDASDLSGPVTISGASASRVFNIAAGASVAMHGLIITLGKAQDGANGPGGRGDDGGGINNDGSLSLFSCAVTNCRSGNGGTSVDFGGNGGGGGGIFNLNRLSLHACTISGNVTGNGGNAGTGSGVGGSGGGIGNLGFKATLTLTACAITGNRTGDGGTNASGGDGGGIISEGGEAALSVTDCTVADNQTGNATGTFGFGGNGGGLYSGETLRLVTSTVSGNRTGSGGTGRGSGGGLYLFGNVILRSSTIAGNTAREGGGIRASADALLLEHCTVAGNASDGVGGGVRIPFSTTPLTLRHSIVAANTAGGGGPDISSAATVTCPVVNFIGNTGGVTISGTAPLTGTPLLAPLSDYGGPTFTMLPLPGSPAINAATGSAATSDQRGLPMNGTPDLGAVEAQAALVGFVDTDSDGMDDRLEVQYGFLVGVADGGLDADGDGSSNRDELGNKTGPRDGAALLKILTFTKTGNNVSVTWTSFPGLSYTLEYGTTLSFGSTVGLGTATGMTNGNTIGPFTAPSAFFRIRRD